jgi:ABC-type uncharacterized transport system permease subunit
MTALLFSSAGLYLVASTLFAAQIAVRGERMIILARLSLTAALAAHLALIGASCVLGQSPLQDVRGALSLSGWLLGVGYLLMTTRRPRMVIIGAILTPLSLSLLGLSRLTPHSYQLPTGSRSMDLLGMVHIALSALGVALFGIAAAISILYLYQEATFKRRRVGVLGRRTPPLTSLDLTAHRLILGGLSVYTLALICGIIWSSRLAVVGGVRIQHVISAITWLVFAGLVLARGTIGLRGRRAALMTLVGFVAIVAVLVIYMSRRILGG